MADRDLETFLGREAALQHLAARHADADNVVGPDPAADLLEHLQGEADPVPETAAVGVGPMVHGRRPKLVRQMG